MQYGGVTWHPDSEVISEGSIQVRHDNFEFQLSQCFRLCDEQPHANRDLKPRGFVATGGTKWFLKTRGTSIMENCGKKVYNLYK